MARATSADIRRLFEKLGWLEGPADALASSIRFNFVTREDLRDMRSEAIVELATQLATKDARIRELEGEHLEVRQRTARWEDVVNSLVLDIDSEGCTSVRDSLLREMACSRVAKGWAPPTEGLISDPTPPPEDGDKPDKED